MKRAAVAGAMKRAAVAGAMLTLAGGALLGSAGPAAACGGLFCNNNQSIVNQTAERILFVNHGNGSMTAAIEILYQGTASRFAWVLPLPDIADPDNDIRVSSTQALNRLQNATNPQYQLTTRIEGDCAQEFIAGDGDGAFANDGASGTGGNTSAPPMDGGVIVEASGNVGPYDYEFISVLPNTPDAAQAAIDWLAANNYDLAGGDELLRPYLESGMKLLAVRLTKGNDAGSIRPLMITYEGTLPSIPIRPTAVAADDDMGVMVFVGGEARSIPVNYKYLELNDSLINWFNPGPTYPQVINFAADEAGGQGFVTEYADDSSTLAEVIFSQGERDTWSSFQQQTFVNDVDVFESSNTFSQYDGYADALGAALMLPNDVSTQDVIDCPYCYLDQGVGVSIDHVVFRLQLYEQVVRPMQDTENLLAEQPYITRQYTTMSAEDMTEDPYFDINPDMDDLSNIHTAEQVIECSSEYYQWEAPYRIELPSGLVVYGEQGQPWPIDIAANMVPATLTIAQAATRGQPEVMVNNREMIQTTLDALRPERRTPGTDPNDPDSPPGGDGDGDGPDAGPDGVVVSEGGGSAAVCGCRTVGTPRSAGMPLALTGLLLGLLWTRRRR